MNHLRRIISLLLVLVLCFGLIPGVSAAEADTPGTDTQTEATEAEETVPTSAEDTQPTEEPPPETESEPEESVPDAEITEPSTEDVPQYGPGIMEAMPNGTSTWAIGSTQKSIMLFDYADNGNYTTVLNSQVACAYKPNGSGTTRTAYIKNLGWHFARYGGVAYADDPLYCIEPWRSYAASTSGNSVDREVTLDGSGSTTGSNVWYALPAARREAIGLILLYSNQMWNHSISVTTISKANNPNVPLRIATQFLIYEIVCGLRDPNTFTLNSTNECGTAGNIFYNAGAASVTNFTSNYNTLVSYIQAAKQDFDLVQRIRGLDTRTSPKQDTVYLFSGVLICGCCGSRMTRKTNRVNGKEYHYYYCPTGKKHGCANPVMLKESKLIDCVQESLKAYIQNVASLETLLNSIDQSSINQALAKEYTAHISENERRLEQAQAYKSRLYENLVEGMITKEEYASYKVKYTRQAEEIKASIAALKEKLTDVLENRSERNRWITHFTQFESMETLDRKALIHMVQSIRVQGKNELDIRFNYKDEYEKALRLIALAAQEAELSIPELLRKAG